MRILKSLLPLLFSFCVCLTHAQDSPVADTTVLIDTVATMNAERDTDVVFHADKPTGITQWKERTVPDSIVQLLHKDDAFWYANADFKKKKPNETERSSLLDNLFHQRWFYNLLWIIIIGSCVAVLILFLAKSNLSFFRKAPTALVGSSNTESSENIFSIDYDEELRKAVAKKDFRLAVRLHFLQTLALLSEKNLIQYQEDFTNSDYLQQLRETNYYSLFRKLTSHFEYAWYGQFDVTPEQYSRIEADFNTFKSSMGL